MAGVLRDGESFLENHESAEGRDAPQVRLRGFSKEAREGGQVSFSGGFFTNHGLDGDFPRPGRGIAFGPVGLEIVGAFGGCQFVDMNQEIVIEPEILAREPVFAGIPVTVRDLLDHLESGKSKE